MPRKPKSPRDEALDAMVDASCVVGVPASTRQYVRQQMADALDAIPPALLYALAGQEGEYDKGYAAGFSDGYAAGSGEGLP